MSHPGNDKFYEYQMEHNMENEKCQDCNKKITWNEYRYSMDLFHKGLCIRCQKEARKELYPKKLADFINKSI